MQIIPIRLLSPEFLVPDDIDDFSNCPAILSPHRISLSQDVSATLDPDGVAEALGELEDDGLFVWHLARVQVVSLGLDDAHNHLRGLQGIGR